jgi:hypothetical protein
MRILMSRWLDKQTKQSEVIMPEGKFCYTIIEGQTDANGNYIPSAVFENELGHYPMMGQGECSVPWTWGPDYKKAMEVATTKNEAMGVSAQEAAIMVVHSTLGAYTGK